MQLVSIKADAAVWNLKIANAARNPHITTQAISSVDPSDPMNSNNKGGGVVLNSFYADNEFCRCICSV